MASSSLDRGLLITKFRLGAGGGVEGGVCGVDEAATVSFLFCFSSEGELEIRVSSLIVFKVLIEAGEC